jgi:hypothetical protein
MTSYVFYSNELIPFCQGSGLNWGKNRGICPVLGLDMGFSPCYTNIKPKIFWAKGMTFSPLERFYSGIRVEFNHTCQTNYALKIAH